MIINKYVQLLKPRRKKYPKFTPTNDVEEEKRGYQRTRSKKVHHWKEHEEFYESNYFAICLQKNKVLGNNDSNFQGITNLRIPFPKSRNLPITGVIHV